MPLMFPNRKWKLDEVCVHQHLGVILRARQMILRKIQTWQVKKHLCTRCHPRVAIATVLKVSTNILICFLIFNSAKWELDKGDIKVFQIKFVKKNDENIELKHNLGISRTICLCFNIHWNVFFKSTFYFQY